MNLAIPADHRVKLKESEKKNKYLLENWKKLLNMKVMGILIVIFALDAFTKGLIMGLEDLEIKGQV